MRVLRSLVFPGLRLVVWAVIAVALVVLAFRGSGADTPVADSAQPPPVDLESPRAPVVRGTVQNTVSVTGTVVADAAVPVKATALGEVRRLLVAPGAVVTAGQGLLEITVTTERDPVTSTDAEGNQVVTPRPPLVTVSTVEAPAAGTVAALDVLVDRDADVFLCSHDADFAPQMEALLGGERRVGVIGLREYASFQYSNLGIQIHDLEDDVQAFKVPLPRVKVIPLDAFDPAYFLR